MIVYVLLSIFILLFEVSFREISLLGNVCLFFILIHLLFWHKRYKVALICGSICGLLIDLMLQNHLGKSLLALFLPLFVLTFFDNVLRVESRVSRLIYLVASTAFSIFISDFLFELVFWKGELVFSLIVQRIVISVIVALFLALWVGKVLLVEEGKAGRYL